MASSTFRVLVGTALFACTWASPIARTPLTKPLTFDFDEPCDHTTTPKPSLVSEKPTFTPVFTVEPSEEPIFESPEQTAMPIPSREPSPHPSTIPLPSFEPTESPDASEHPYETASSPSHPSASPSSSVYPSASASATAHPSSSPSGTAYSSSSPSGAVYPSSTLSGTAYPTSSPSSTAQPSATASPYPTSTGPEKCYIRDFDLKHQTAVHCCEKRFKCSSLECKGTEACKNPDMCYCRKPVCKKIYIHYSFRKELSGDCADQLIHL